MVQSNFPSPHSFIYFLSTFGIFVNFFPPCASHLDPYGRLLMQIKRGFNYCSQLRLFIHGPKGKNILLIGKN